MRASSWRLATRRTRARMRPSSLPARVHDNTWLTLPPSSDSPRTALLLLNTPPRPASALRQLWALSSYRVCADAAANRLRDSIQLALGSEMVSGSPLQLRQRLVEMQHVAQQHESMTPDAVTGDFDSISPDVLEFYAQRGCRIVHDPSPDSTDFDKALHLVLEAQAATLRRCQSARRWTVVAFGAFGDRFDHEVRRAPDRLLLAPGLDGRTATCAACLHQRAPPVPTIWAAPADGRAHDGVPARARPPCAAPQSPHRRANVRLAPDWCVAQAAHSDKRPSPAWVMPSKAAHNSRAATDPRMQAALATRCGPPGCAGTCAALRCALATSSAPPIRSAPCSRRLDLAAT